MLLLLFGASVDVGSTPGKGNATFSAIEMHVTASCTALTGNRESFVVDL